MSFKNSLLFVDNSWHRHGRLRAIDPIVLEIDQCSLKLWYWVAALIFWPI